MLEPGRAATCVKSKGEDIVVAAFFRWDDDSQSAFAANQLHVTSIIGGLKPQN